MKVQALIVGLAGLLTATTSSSHPRAADWTVYLRRAGPLTVGMTIDQVRRKLGDPRASLVQAVSETQALPQEPNDSPCAYMTTQTIPAQIGLMFAKGVLARIDVWKPGIRTASGAQVGDAEARILDLYGARIKVTQHKYPPAGAHYLIFTPVDAADRDYQMLFETDGVRVTRFRIGLREAVAQVEGCA